MMRAIGKILRLNLISVSGTLRRTLSGHLNYQKAVSDDISINDHRGSIPT